MGHQWYFRIAKPILRVLFFWWIQSAHMGALPLMRAAVDSNVIGSDYYGPSGGSKGHPIKVESNTASHNLEEARKLWVLSEN